MSFARSAVAGLVQGGAGNAIRAAVQFGATLYLARIVGPEAFGTVAACWLVISIARLIADFGLSSALVQSEEISREDVNGVFTAQIVVGAILSTAGFLLAPLISDLLGQPESARVLKWMVILFAINAVAQVPQSLLIRELRMGRVQGALTASYLFGNVVVAVPMATWGMGVWSLVAGQMVQATTAGLFLYFSLPSAQRPILGSMASALAKLKFGVKVICANMVSWLLMNFDSFVMSRIYGSAGLGLYNRAQTLVNTPATVITSTLQQSVFAIVSRMDSRSTERVEGAFIAICEITLIFTLPAFALIAATSHSFIAAAYGIRWMGSTELLRPLALAVPFYILLCIIGPMLMARDKTHIELAAQGATALVAVPAVIMSGGMSMTAIAWTAFAMTITRCAFLMGAMRVVFGLRWLLILRALLVSGSMGVLVAGIGFTLERQLLQQSPFIRLAVIALSGAATWIACMLIGGGQCFSSETKQYLRNRIALPPWMATWLVVRER